MANHTLARTAAVVVLAAVAFAGCGARGQANVNDTNSLAGSPAAVSVPATEDGTAPSAPSVPSSGTSAQPSPASGPAVSVPDISTQLQAVDGLLSGVGGDVQQSDSSAGSGE